MRVASWSRSGSQGRRPVVFLAAALTLIAVGHVAFAESDSEDLDSSSTPDASAKLYPMEIRNPPSLGTVTTGIEDAIGSSVGISCVTCHEPNSPGALAMKNEVPADFHAGIDLRHGSLECESCHAPEDRTRLRLASGETVGMDEVVRLCGQCHGPTLRDFMHGAHGGGRGYWDRTRGPWIRNSCVACHRAHSPSFPKVRPAAPPNDRFLPLPHRDVQEHAH